MKNGPDPFLFVYIVLFQRVSVNEDKRCLRSLQRKKAVVPRGRKTALFPVFMRLLGSVYTDLLFAALNHFEFDFAIDQSKQRVIGADADAVAGKD